MPELPTLTGMLLGCAVMAVGATVQGAVGMGMGLITAPILILIHRPFVPGPILVCTLVLSALVSFRERGSMDGRGVAWGLFGRVFGVAAAVMVLRNLHMREMTITLGVLILAGVALSLSGLHIRISRRSLLGAGAVSGFTGTTVSIGGPPMALLYQKEAGPRFRSTMAGFFMFGAVLSLAGLVVGGQFGLGELLAGLGLLPGAIVGFAVSGPLRPWLDRGYTRPAVLVISAVSGVVVILRELL